MLLTHTSVSFLLWWHEGPPPFIKSLFVPLFVRVHVCDKSPKYQVFHEHNFVIRMLPRDHFFYSFQITEAILHSHTALLSSRLRAYLEMLRKVIKRTSQVPKPAIHIGSVFSFPFISLPHFSPIILLWVLLRSYYGFSKATWKPS